MDSTHGAIYEGVIHVITSTFCVINRAVAQKGFNSVSIKRNTMTSADCVFFIIF